MVKKYNGQIQILFCSVSLFLPSTLQKHGDATRYAWKTLKKDT